MATIKSVPGKKGVWEIRFDTQDAATGKRRQHRRHFAGTKPEAKTYLSKIEAEIKKGEYDVDLEQATIREYLEKWLKEYCKPNLAYRTYESYSGTIHNHILPNLGGLKLSALKPAHIQSYYSKMTASNKDGGAELSGTSVLYHHRILREALKHAVNLGYIQSNPADKTQPPRKNKPEIKTLSIEQAQFILNTYKDHRICPCILIAIKTGMRLGEICALRWQNIDLEAGSISVTHALQRQNSILVLKEPKTKKSRRCIPIPADLVAELKKIQHRQKLDKLSFGEGYDNRGFVCAWEDGRPFDPKYVSKAWAKIVKDDNNIPDGVRFHDLRHTHATILLGQDVNIKIVQERLGHESITTTGDIYSHVTPAMQQKVVNILEQVFTQ